MATNPSHHAALRFLPGPVRARLRNPHPRPHWIAGTDQFWYRHEAPDGITFTRVDAATGAQSPAFDHARAAAQVTRLTGQITPPGRLPVTDIDLQPTAARLRLENGRWLQLPTEGDATLDPPTPRPLPGDTPNPAATTAAFIRQHDLWLRDLATGAERRLTQDGAAHHAYAKSPDMNLTTISLQRRGVVLPANVLWSPDGARLLTSRLDERGVADLPLLQHAPPGGNGRPESLGGNVRPVLHSIKYAMSGDPVLPTESFLIIDALTGVITPARMPPAIAGVTTAIEKQEAWWSSDGSRAYLLTRDRLWQRQTLHEIDAATGTVRDLFTETSATHIDTNVSVAGLPNIRVLDRLGVFIWYSQESGWGHLHLHDLATGARRHAITSGDWLVRDLLHVDETAGTLHFLAANIVPGANPYHRTLCRIGLNGTGLAILTPGDANHALAMPLARNPRDHIRPPAEQGDWRAPSGRYFVHTASDLTTLPVTDIRRADGSLVATLATAEFDGPWRAPLPFTTTADDGQTTLHGAIWLPTDFDPAKKYPVIDYIYPGPQRGQTPEVLFTDILPDLFRAWLPQAFAELGFAVINVDGRGTPLRSKAFQDASYGRLQDPGTLSDHVATLRQLAARHDWMDLSRVGIMGHSGGGYASVRALLDYPDVFHAAIATSGNHDQMGYSYAWTEKYQGPVTHNPDGTTSYSRAANPPDVSRLRGALLLAHGDMDDNVHPALTLQLVDALIAADKDFDYIPLPNDDHTTVWGKPYFLRRAMDFMQRHLRPGY